MHRWILLQKFLQSFRLKVAFEMLQDRCWNGVSIRFRILQDLTLFLTAVLETASVGRSPTCSSGRDRKWKSMGTGESGQDLFLQSLSLLRFRFRSLRNLFDREFLVRSSVDLFHPWRKLHRSIETWRRGKLKLNLEKFKILPLSDQIEFTMLLFRRVSI